MSVRTFILGPRPSEDEHRAFWVGNATGSERSALEAMWPQSTDAARVRANIAAQDFVDAAMAKFRSVFGQRT